jgi:hypothetical protein
VSDIELEAVSVVCPLCGVMQECAVVLGWTLADIRTLQNHLTDTCQYVTTLHHSGRERR